MARPTRAQRAAIAQRRPDAIELQLAGVDWLTIGRKLAADPRINSDRIAYPQGYSAGDQRFGRGTVSGRRNNAAMWLLDRTTLPTWVRQAVLSANGGWCTYCELGEAEAVDHVVPVDKGGRDDIYNLVPACESCNSSKKNRTLREWQRAIERRPAYSFSFGARREYHFPDYVANLTLEGIERHVAKVQQEVIELCAAYQSDAARKLLDDLNRLVTRLGHLNPEQRKLLCEEAQLRLASHEAVLSGTAKDRRTHLREASDRQFWLRLRFEGHTAQAD
ncbi:HNH endonuclease signature motif containing protein [Kitasatospora sp. NPDC002227]|uniref:HNH endonuclease n=1 Tax=Kitasatospora sp. NPDC002227 TaxID=3154773 RepID=UPI00331EF376